MGVAGGAALLSVGLVGKIIHRASHSKDINGKKFAKESYNRIELRVVMAMLVHWCYFRDLNLFEEGVAWFLEYDNERARNYGEQYWEPHPCDELYPGELEQLGLAFLRKKYYHSNGNAPDLVIVLRGTIPTRPADLAADWKIGIQQLDHTERVVRVSRLIVQVVEEFQRENPGKRICMAGHSLGAAIGHIVGGCLYATHNIDIDTHLFNPPLLTLVDVARGLPPSTPPDRSDPYCCKMKLDFSKLKEALVVNEAAVNREWEQFRRLQHWVPKIYLNPGDPICRQFIAFYKGREGRPVRSPGDVISPQGLLSGLFSENVTYLKNVVPSADLYISTWTAKPKWHAKLAPRPIKEVVAGRLPHSLRQWHKFDEEYIEISEHQARLLQQPHSFDQFVRTVSPPIPDFSYLSQ